MIINCSCGQDFEADKLQTYSHRLLCGDSLNKDHIAKLMNGQKAKLLFTSPPYNMAGQLYKDYSDDLKSEEYIKLHLNALKSISDYIDGFVFWNVSYNKNARWEFLEILYRIAKETKFKFLELIVWDKGHAMPITSKEALTRQYEDILMVGDPDAIQNELELYYVGSNETRAYFHKKNNKGITNYWRITTNNIQLENLQAVFPVALPARGIQLMTQKHDIVVDIFGGSGTVLIAAEQLDRVAYLVELSPKYCDLIKLRYKKYRDNANTM